MCVYLYLKSVGLIIPPSNVSKVWFVFISDFESPYEECIHISVMKHLVDEFDVEHNISAQTLIDSS